MYKFGNIALSPSGEDNTLFVELFDEEYKDFKRRRPTNLQHLMGDECMLLGPVYTPLTGEVCPI